MNFDMSFNKYKNNMVPPRSTHFMTQYWYSAGLLCWKQAADDQRPIKMQTFGPAIEKCVREKCVDEAALNVAKAAYKEKGDRLHQLFKSDLFEDLGIADNPKREMLFTKAWEHGHSSGYSEVYHYALEIVDLIK